MFPHTGIGGYVPDRIFANRHRYESVFSLTHATSRGVCLLYHQKKDFISVPYEPKDAEYLKMIPGNAAYDEIKEYVLKKYNVKVSSLYVAQVSIAKAR